MHRLGVPLGTPSERLPPHGSPRAERDRPHRKDQRALNRQRTAFFELNLKTQQSSSVRFDVSAELLIITKINE